MARSTGLADVAVAAASCFYEVARFWSSKVYRSVWRKSDEQILLDSLNSAQTYEQWEAIAAQLDETVNDNYYWRKSPASPDYDFKLIEKRNVQTEDALEDMDVHTLVHILRSGLVRNLGNITSPKLYNCAWAGTKELIETYVTQVAYAIMFVTGYPTSHESGLTNQQKMDLLHDARLAYGRSCLVLQGGSIFGLCHIGVVKALHLRGLLPRIIAGTGTGALMAALVGVHTEEELLDFLSGEGIDLSAFAEAADDAREHLDSARRSLLATLLVRAKRFLQYGYVLDVRVLEQCVRANVGDLTFEEAYHRTKRVLNITISATGGGVPSLLNYLTAPNVLIWSAAMASNAADARFSPITLQCKTSDGRIIPWNIPAQVSLRQPRGSAYTRTPSTDHDRDTPLSRVAELFNVNHFIISQARPYLAPFLAPSLNHSHSARSSRVPWSSRIMHLAILETQHRLTQMDQLGWLSPGIRRLLLDESVPGASWTLVPQVGLSDFTRLLRNPTREEIDYWILRGEREVWPAVVALKIRCAIEVELDRGYQLVRRKKPFDFVGGRGLEGENGDGEEEVRARKRKKTKKMRSASLGAA
ncbi:putative patatin-like serine hydrolase [Teratosphaeria nubilosa]|uniref:Putative patatin-like serine hydrolase n=1 Tax=Teratosphaeria nubilosa TaxID=161662 RepID=A0A6G1LDF5_9PEZI|nr:putative patatin-like serine hydrolase [Teratosphaeria nubilosa]